MTPTVQSGNIWQPVEGCAEQEGRVNGVSICSGVAGLELGLHLAIPDYRTVLWCEYDHRAAATLVSNFGQGLDPAPIWDDVRTLSGGAWRGKVDILSAGFPCQPFSHAGKQQGEDDPRHLWPHVLRVIRECEPTQVFLENVPGIITTHAADGRPAAIVVREDLERLGYRVEEGLFSAEEVGAPHRRIRWFLLADIGTEYTSLGNPLSPRRAVGKRRNIDSGAEPQAGSRRGFPPGPEGDWREWPEWAAPATESSVRGSADGLANGMDLCMCGRRARLQQCENGVVPMTAALAYQTLNRRDA